MKKINVVQIGVGHDHAHDAVDFLRNCKSINFLGYVKFPNEEEIFLLHKERYEGLKELNYNDVLNSKDIDCAFIDVDDRYLTQYAFEFIRRNIPIELDKPGSQDPQSFNELFALAKEKNVPIHMGYMYRYNLAIKRAKEIVESKVLGEIKYIDLDMSTWHPKEKRQWLNYFQGGMMYFLGCHLIDILLQFQGEPDEVIPLNKRSENDVGEDIGFAKFRYGNEYSTVYTSDTSGGFEKRHVNIYLEKGNIKIQPIELFNDQGFININLAIESNGNIEVINFPPFKRYDDMYNEFFDIVNKKIDNPYSYDYEVKLHNLILKACAYKED